jgi:hypothetical protein
MLCLKDEEATPIWKPVTGPYGFADAPNLKTTFMLENAHCFLKNQLPNSYNILFS